MEIDIITVPAHYAFCIYLLKYYSLSTMISFICEEILILLILCNLLKLEPLLKYENLFFSKDVCHFNSMICFKFTNTTTRNVSEILKCAIKSLTFTSVYQKIVCYGGYYFFKRVPSIDFDYHFQVREDILNASDELDFSKKLLQTKLDYSHPLWQCTICKLDNDAANCYIVHHLSMADGLSFLINILTTFDGYKGMIQKMLYISIPKKIYTLAAMLIFPIIAYFQAITRSPPLWKKEENYIQFAMSEAIDIEKIKTKANENACSVNDVVLYGILTSLQKANPLNKSNIVIGNMISVREELGKYFHSAIDCRAAFSNDSYPLASISDNESESLSDIGKINTQVTQSQNALNAYYSAFFIRWLIPTKMLHKVFSLFTSHHSLLYINIAGPDYPICFDQAMLSSMYQLFPNCFSTPVNIFSMSYNKKLILTCTSSTHQLDAQQLMLNFTKHMSSY